MLLAQLLAFTPIAFLVLIGVVEGVSPTLEEASQTLRADRWATFATVSLPLMRPGLANAFLVGFIESMADFGNPIVLGGNYGVLSTEIFFAVVGAQHDYGRAAVLALAAAGLHPRRLLRCSAGSSASAPTPPSPARAMPACRRRCPIARAARGAMDRPALGRLHLRCSTASPSSAAS